MDVIKAYADKRGITRGSIISSVKRRTATLRRNRRRTMRGQQAALAGMQQPKDINARLESLNSHTIPVAKKAIESIKKQKVKKPF